MILLNWFLESLHNHVQYRLCCLINTFLLRILQRHATLYTCSYMYFFFWFMINKSYNDNNSHNHYAANIVDKALSIWPFLYSRYIP